MTLKELIEGIESGTHQIRVRAIFELEDYFFQFLPEDSVDEPVWEISVAGKIMVENYENLRTGKSDIFTCNSWEINNKIEYEEASEGEIKLLNAELDWQKIWVGKSAQVYSVTDFPRSGVVVLSKDYAKSLLEEFISGDDPWLDNLNRTWNIQSQIPDEFYVDFPYWYWDESAGGYYPNDFFEENIGEGNIDEFLELKEDYIDTKPIIGVNLGPTTEIFRLDIYKQKGV